MCLRPQWFAEAKERQKRREEFGYSVCSLEEDLDTITTTLYPVAFEAVHYIDEHPEVIDQLSTRGRAIYDAAVNARRVRKRPRRVDYDMKMIFEASIPPQD